MKFAGTHRARRIHEYRVSLELGVHNLMKINKNILIGRGWYLLGKGNMPQTPLMHFS